MDDLAHLMTPAFLVDKQIVQRNCDRMRRKAEASGVIFRPHVKTHKTREIGRMQHGGGTGPITVSTLAEAEFFAGDGFRDITYAVPVAPEKLERAAVLARRIGQLNLLVDSFAALQALEQFGHRFDVFLKVDCGYHRAGVDPAKPESAELARKLAQSPVVNFRGFLTHAGHSYDAKNPAEIAEFGKKETAAVMQMRERARVKGICSVGSTPTMSVAARFEADEVRPGNYVFYDAFQATIGSCAFEDCAMSVLATVVGSYPDRKSMIIDAGALALSKDRGPEHVDPNIGYGMVCDLALKRLPMRLHTLSQEHGKIESEIVQPVGTRLRVIPNHSCLTSAMYDRYHVVENGSIAAEWHPVRGW
jgi:D-serine deaminase-like pyridoxal phosphate-dependent protein